MKQCFLKEIVAWMLLIVVIITIVAWTGYLFIPERYDYGALWNMYLCEPNNTIDTIIIGSSLAYCDVMPSVIDEITGERSYVLAAPELTAALSYYYVVEALKTQSPDLIVIEVTSLLWGKYAGYSKIDVGYMPFGLNRVKATLDAAEQEQRFGLFVPIYNYHDRWQYVNPIKYVMGRSDSKIDINAGYTYLDEAVEQNEIKDRNYDISDTEFEENLKYLEDTIDFCRLKNVQVQLFVAPQCYYPDKEHIDMIRQRFSDIKLIDYNDQFDALDLDMKVDFFDFMHLNCFGAEKFSKILATNL